MSNDAIATLIVLVWGVGMIATGFYFAYREYKNATNK